MDYWAPDTALVGDSKPTTKALTAALAARGVNFEDRSAKIAAAKAKVREEIIAVQPQMDILDTVRDILPADGFVTGEMTQVGFTSQVGFPVYAPRRIYRKAYLRRKSHLGHLTRHKTIRWQNIANGIQNVHLGLHGDNFFTHLRFGSGNFCAPVLKINAPCR